MKVFCERLLRTNFNSSVDIIEFQKPDSNRVYVENVGTWDNELSHISGSWHLFFVLFIPYLTVRRDADDVFLALKRTLAYQVSCLKDDPL